MTMKLYTFSFSPNCRKVEAVVRELDISLERIPINLFRQESRTPAFMKINPNGRVPVLEDDGYVLWESTAILRYLATGTRLLPAEQRAAGDVDRWLAWHLAHLALAMRKVAVERLFKKNARGPDAMPDQALIDAGTAEFHTFSTVLDGALAEREHVAGDLSIADFALAAHYSLAGACELDTTAHAHVDAWLARMMARPSMRHAIELAKAAA